MRIMHIIGTLGVGGAEKVVLNLHNFLDGNIHSLVTCLTPEKAALETYGFSNNNINFFDLRIKNFFLQLSQYLF